VESSRRPPVVPSAAERGERRFSLFLLLLMSATFIAYNVAFVPRLGNNHFGDIEFSGWSGPMGSRLLRGERPYLDFILPIPPGSFAILAGLEWLVGKPRLVTELWLNTALHLAMAWLAYAIVRPFTSGRNAFLAAFCTLITVVQLNKECAYDHTAQTVAWGSFAVGGRALLCDDPARRAKLWLAVGFLAGLTFLFKQSTALGAVAGWVTCLGYLALSEWRGGNRELARAFLPDAWSLAKGIVYGLWITWAALVLLGSTGSAFFQASFLDASVLKGGPKLLLQNVFAYLFAYPAYPGSLFLIACFVLLAMRLVKVRGTLSLGDEPARAAPYTTLDRILVPIAILAAFAGGGAVLVWGPPGYPFEWVLEFDRLKQVPYFGLLLTAVLFVAQIVRVPPRVIGIPIREDPVRVGHVLNGLWLGAFVCTILHNTSAPEFRPFYDNNPIVPLAFLAFLTTFDRAKVRWLQAIVVTAMVASLGGNRFYRAMIAVTDAREGTHWAGMTLGPRGAVMDAIAERVRELTTAGDTVLVLPEDVQLVSQIGRPRPDLRGAIVFVDQYAPRLAEGDTARLEAKPPKVVVVHPRDTRDWQRFFRIWSGKSGAERVMQHVLQHMLPARYRLDRSYPTMFLWEPATLDIYVRRDPGDEPEAEDADTVPSPEGDEEPHAAEGSKP
jgi:hypothetical protein